MKRSKSLRAADKKREAGKIYTPTEAVKLMKELSTVKFDATAEVHFNLGINPKHADQQIRSNVSLPHGTGKKVRVIAVCSDDKTSVAKAAGAIEAGAEDLIEKIIKGWTDFDAVVATPDMMKNLAKAARTLGPKGLMPNPKAGTVTPDIEKAIGELKAGRIEIRNDKNGIVHTIFGKLSFGEKPLTENLQKMIETIKEVKPAGQKGDYIKSISINSTMGVGIRVQA
jgi:large subunit ribosomal protein L1